MSDTPDPQLHMPPFPTGPGTGAAAAPAPEIAPPPEITPVEPPATDGGPAEVISERLREVPARRLRLATVRLLMAGAAIASVRYFTWRTLHTFNPVAKWFFYIFLVAEIMSWVEAALFYFSAWKPTRWAAPPPLPGRSVDVFITTYNEPVELLRETLVCATSMRYPHKTYLLDDGNRLQVRELAREFGCGYISRSERDHAKAGNLNNALRFTSGEFIVTLDADHIPMPDLIEKMIGFFANAQVGVVQTPQDFYNLDSFHHHTDWRDRYAWHQQELFFAVIQPGKDRFNAAYYCGSPAMIRRKALEDVGGFATESITEDMHTGLKLQKKGWRLLYYNRTVARGLGPQTYTGFATQWHRWGVGAMQVLRREKVMWSSGLSLGQRICYFSSFYFYWLGYQKFIFLITPIFSLLAGVFPLVADPTTFAWYFGPHFVLNIAVLAMLQGGLRSFLLSEQFHVIKFHVLMNTVVGLFRREHKFKVTPKARSEAPRWTEVWPQIAAFGLANLAVIVGTLRLYSAAAGYLFWALVVNLFWAGFFVFLTMGIIRRALQSRELRSTYRFPSQLDLPVLLRTAGTEEGKAEKLFARNLNRTGFSITRDQPIAVGQQMDFQFQLPTGSVVRGRGRVVRNQTYVVNAAARISSGIRFEQIEPRDQDEISKYLFWEIAPKHGSILRLTYESQKDFA